MEKEYDALRKGYIFTNNGKQLFVDDKLLTVGVHKYYDYINEETRTLNTTKDDINKLLVRIEKMLK